MAAYSPYTDISQVNAAPNHGQYLMTPEEAASDQEYLYQLKVWEASERQNFKSVVIGVIGTPVLFSLSYWAAGMEGAVNRSGWFNAFMIGTFVLALVSTVMTIGSIIFYLASSEPPIKAPTRKNL